MKTPEQSLKTGRTIGRVFQIILLGGILVVAVPFAMGMDDMDVIAVGAIGGFITLIGLIGTVVMSGRTKVMSRILAGDTFIDSWDDAEHGTIILSTEGFYFSELLYTMKGYSCYISKAESVNKQLIVQYHMARRNGHKRYKIVLTVPAGHETGVQRFVEATRLAWGDKPLPYDQEEADKDIDENIDNEMDDE